MPELFDFKNANSAEKKVFEITSFAGIDLSSAPADIDKRRSPDAPNMMPDSKGNPIKRTGFSFLEDYGKRINGVFVFGEHRIVHAGEDLFIDSKKVFEGMGDRISSGQIIGEKLYIFDGFKALVCDGNTVHPLCEEAYVPTVLISKNADGCERKTVFKGDGTSTKFVLEQKPEEIISVTVGDMSTEHALSEETIVFETAPEENSEITVIARYKNEPGGVFKEEFNLISSRWKESFICETGTERSFSLSQQGLSEGIVKAWIMDEHGNFIEKAENIDFSVDRENGKIVFEEPVLKTPVEGEDNVLIEAEKYFEGYKDRIDRCSRSISFGNGGTSDRIFVCGNPQEPDRDFWCSAGNPAYWPDTYYSEICGKGSEILGYSVMENKLASYISCSKDGRSIVIRTCEIDNDGNAFFPIEKHLQGEEAIAPKGFVFMDREQLFLTARGVYAITAEDVSGEKYTQNRSYFINKVLCAEEHLKDSFCTKWERFFVISIPGSKKLYLLDTSQRSYQRGEPLSSFQYECYLWTGIDARVLWEQNGKLYFGNENGEIFVFSSDKDSAVSYEDGFKSNRKPITAYWTVPDFFGDVFWKNKTIRTVALVLAPYAQNRIRLEVKKEGFWKVLKEWTGKISYFAWNAINWEDFLWSGDKTPRTVTLRTKIKKFDKTSFRIVCDEIDKAFGLYGFSVEYSENGRYKK